MKVKRHVTESMESEAAYSDCENYRYVLTHEWDASLPRVLFIGLNPSTATEQAFDPTLKRMVGFAKRWGFGSMSVCNLFAYRATFPNIMKKQEDPIGPDNDMLLQRELELADKVVAAWGNHGSHLSRGDKVLSFLQDYSHFGFTKVGHPKHVLYLANDTSLYAGENSP